MNWRDDYHLMSQVRNSASVFSRIEDEIDDYFKQKFDRGEFPEFEALSAYEKNLCCAQKWHKYDCNRRSLRWEFNEAVAHWQPATPAQEQFVEAPRRKYRKSLCWACQRCAEGQVPTPGRRAITMAREVLKKYRDEIVMPEEEYTMAWAKSYYNYAIYRWKDAHGLIKHEVSTYDDDYSYYGRNTPD